MKCTECPDYKACSRQNDLRRKRHKCKKANEPFAKTKADRIRAMSDEELAAWLMALSCICECCARVDECIEVPGYNECQKGAIEWLKQPVKDGEDDV